MSTITTSGEHDIKPGHIVCFTSTVSDNRWWVRVRAWLLRRPVPVRKITKTYRVNYVAKRPMTMEEWK